jgi:hypothetical protein
VLHVSSDGQEREQGPEDNPDVNAHQRRPAAALPLKTRHPARPTDQRGGLSPGSVRTALPFQCSAYMSLRADTCRQKAAEAKLSAARAQNPFVKRAFEEVAAGWLVLAEQTQWIEWQRARLRDENVSN